VHPGQAQCRRPHRGRHGPGQLGPDPSDTALQPAR